MYYDIAICSCFLLQACKGEQCTKYGVLRKPDHGLVVHIIAKDHGLFVHVIAKGSRFRWSMQVRAQAVRRDEGNRPLGATLTGSPPDKWVGEPD